MRLLAIDTATEFCSVALTDGQATLIRGEEAPRRHADLLLPFVQSVLAEAGLSLQQLDGLIIGRGPGSFTGVRIAAGVGQGLAFSADLPVVGVSSLQAMAQAAWRLHEASHVVSAIDARMGEVYVGTYSVIDGLMSKTMPEQVMPPTQVSLASDIEWRGVGTGFETYTEILQNAAQPATVQQLKDIRLPHALDMLPLGLAAFTRNEGVAADQFEVHYVRNEVTWQKLPGRA